MHNQTPFLPGIPRFLCGRAKSSEQDKLRRQVHELVDRCPGELSAQLSRAIPAAMVAAAVTVPRRRHFPHEVTFWAFLSQIFSHDGSCAHAVARVQCWARDHGMPVPSADTSSYCKARQRLPSPMLDTIHSHLLDSLDRNLSDDVLWCGHRVKAVDYGYSANYSYSYSAKHLMLDIPYECATLNYDLPGIAP